MFEGSQAVAAFFYISTVLVRGRTLLFFAEGGFRALELSGQGFGLCLSSLVSALDPVNLQLERMAKFADEEEWRVPASRKFQLATSRLGP